MLKTNKIHCYYFSGTGNTLAMVIHFVNLMKKKGYTVIVHQMENDPYLDSDEDFTLGLMFPVAIQSSFPLVWNFIKNLPDGKGRDVFMFDTMQSFSGGIVGPVKKVLTGKGYNCIAAREFKMSSSLNTDPDKVIRGEQKNKAVLKEVEQFASDLIEGRTKWTRVPLLSDLMGCLSKSGKIWRSNSEKITVCDKCVCCLMCEKNCPAGAIKRDSQSMIIDHSLCISCMRCAANCPKNAVLYENKELHLSEIYVT